MKSPTVKSPSVPAREGDLSLAQSLEHHKALVSLLSRLQSCRTSKQVIEALIDEALALSWLGISTSSAGFLVRGDALEMVVSRNLSPKVVKRCALVPSGYCLCGKTMETKQLTVLTSCEMEEEIVEHRDMGVHGHAAVPLVYEGKLLGLLNFYLASGDDLDEAQRALLNAISGAASGTLAEYIVREEAELVRKDMRRMEQNLLGRVIASQEDERKRIARELHDDLGQALVALQLQLKSAVERRLPHGEIQERLDETIRRIVGKVSQLAWDLRPSILDDYGLKSALSRYVEKVSLLAELPIGYESAGFGDAGDRLHPDIEIVLYRVAQEALNNVVRHADAARASVVLVRKPESVTLLIEDDGRGFDAGKMLSRSGRAGLGLEGMKERLSLVKGSLLILSEPGEGTTVRATVPIGGRRRSGR